MDWLHHPFCHPAVDFRSSEHIFTSTSVQVLTTEQDAVSLFKLKNLIHFYLHVVKSIVSPVHSSIASETGAADHGTSSSAPAPHSASTGVTSGGGAVEGDASLTMTSSTPAGDSSLLATLTALHGLAEKMFLNALNCQGKKDFAELLETVLS